MTQEELKELLTYSPATGEWKWNVLKSGVRHGQIAGSVCKVSAGKGKFNYRRVITIKYKRYYSSRLAWLYMTGSWPVQVIDHIDRNSLNDKWENLRDVSKKQDFANISVINTDGRWYESYPH